MTKLLKVFVLTTLIVSSTMAAPNIFDNIKDGFKNAGDNIGKAWKKTGDALESTPVAGQIVALSRRLSHDCEGASRAYLSSATSTGAVIGTITGAISTIPGGTAVGGAVGTGAASKIAPILDEKFKC